ncbi:hypothetical protein LOK49_Contig14G00020 [Camellia lanceoleosa]|nr:hypothetical protein LOK49_Contig14G00020 [Camellia lanceoleosa]
MLIATVIFATGFIMPSGYDGNQGPEQGMPVLLRAAAFLAFVITNTIAMICSISTGFLCSSTSFYNEVKAQEHRHLIAFWLILVAIGAMVVAFITGTYTVLSHSLGIAIIACIVGSFSFFILIPEVFKLYNYEYITNPDSAIISEEIRKSKLKIPAYISTFRRIFSSLKPIQKSLPILKNLLRGRYPYPS